LGVSFTIAESSSGGPFVSISADGKTLLLQQTLFRGQQECLTAAQSLPAQPLPSLFPNREELDAGLFCDERVPIIYGASGSDGRWIARSPGKILISADILGSSFFMLSRMEEAIKCDRDVHGRFPSTASLAYQEMFLHRPIVNEYLEILWAAMRL